MRKLYLAIIFLMLFNSFLVLTAVFFDGNVEYSAVNITSDSEFSDYQDFGNIGNIILVMLQNPVTWGLIAIVTVSSGVVGYFTGGAKNVALYLGIGLFISVLTGLFSSSITVLTNNQTNPLVLGTVNMISVILSLLFVFTIAEMLSGQGGVD